MGNRDEFLERPTAPLHVWDNGVRAGKDLQDGGTWMGMTPGGKFAAITNYRDPDNIKTNVPSRGGIITNYLTNRYSPGEYLDLLNTSGKQYNGFNIFFGDVDDLYYFNNIEMRGTKLDSGIYGLSNALLDTPWPKVKKSKNAFKQLLRQPPTTDELFEVFSDTETAHAAELPSTGIPKDIEQQLSAICIQMPDYGTRTTSVLLVDNNGFVTFREKTIQTETDTYLTFTIG